MSRQGYLSAATGPMWKELVADERDSECSYDQAQERGKFMTAASKILMTADAGVLEVTGLRGLMRNVADADMVDMSKHLEALVFGWSQA
jgi:hypothetical protein